MTTVTEAAPLRRNRRRPRRRPTVAGVLGELLITAGVVVLLFVAWQLWIGDMIYGAQNNAEGDNLSREWSTVEPTNVPVPPETEPGNYEPVILEQPGDAEVFGILRVPRFGDDFQVRIAGGTSRSRTLDTIGIGHYQDTQMPGEVGNFAIAAHRTTYGGAPFYDIDKLQIGDPIIVETEVGWYVYRFRSMEYVPPSAIDVVAPVPQNTNAPDGERYLTMTSCYPIHTSNARIIGYSVFESFTPRGVDLPDVLVEAGVA